MSSPISGPRLPPSRWRFRLARGKCWCAVPCINGYAPELYYRAVTAHGTTFAYVFPTLVAMGFGYAVCAVSLGRPMRGLPLAWISFLLVIAGAAMALATVAAGNATVLYTFYPPLLGSPYYYLGILIAVIGSWIWIGLMVWHFRRWKVDHPGLPVPLAMFATTAGALLWGWTSLGVGAEIVFLILPNAFGWTPTIDPGLARLLFSWTLHAIVYFWLIPAYISFYVLLPQAAGGRLYSDKMGRIAFLLLLVFSMPIGIHHLFVDPQIGAGFKFLHAVFTGMVAVPTLLTIFTICASLEIAGRLRGGRGPFGWIAALPWDRPFVLASGFSMVMLGLGGASGIINMSYVAELDGPQYAMGYRPFSPDLRWRGRDHVLRDRIRALASIDGSTACSAKARSPAIVDLVRRDAARYAARGILSESWDSLGAWPTTISAIPRWLRRAFGSAYRRSAASFSSSRRSC